MTNLKALEEGRFQYRNDGGLNFFIFALMLVPVFLTSFIVGGLLELFFRLGFYLLIFMPLIFCLPVWGMVYLAVKFSGCRNYWLAGLTGSVASMFAYFSMYYLGLFLDTGFQFLLDVNMWVDYYMFRSGNTTTSSSGGNPSNTPQAMAMLMDGIELFSITLIGWLVGSLRSLSVFDRENRRWYSRKSIITVPEYLDYAKAEGMSEEAIKVLLASPEVAPADAQRTAVYIDHADPDVYSTSGQQTDFPPVFITVCKGLLVSRVVDRVSLLPREIAWLSLKFPELKRLVSDKVLNEINEEIEENTNELEKIKEESESTSEYGFEETSKQSSKVEIIDLMNQSHGPAGEALKTGSVLFGNLLTFFGLFVVAVGGGIISLGYNLMINDMKVVGIAMIVVGGIVLLYGLVRSLRLTRELGDHYKRKVTKQIEERSNPFVSPNNAEAIFVKIVPAKNISTPHLEDASDVGFFYYDEHKQMLLFEGDRERFRIPISQLSYAGILDYKMQYTRMVFLVIQMPNGMQVWEAPIRPLDISPRKSMKLINEYIENMQQANPKLRQMSG